MNNEHELDCILRFISKRYEVCYKEIQGQKRNANITRIRDIYCYVAKCFVNDFEDIAHSLNRNRATIYNGYKNVVNQMNYNKEYKQEIEKTINIWKNIAH